MAICVGVYTSLMELVSTGHLNTAPAVIVHFGHLNITPINAPTTNNGPTPQLVPVSADHLNTTTINGSNFKNRAFMTPIIYRPEVVTDAKQAPYSRCFPLLEAIKISTTYLDSRSIVYAPGQWRKLELAGKELQKFKMGSQVIDTLSNEVLEKLAPRWKGTIEEILRKTILVSDEWQRRQVTWLISLIQLDAVVRSIVAAEGPITNQSKFIVVERDSLVFDSGENVRRNLEHSVTNVDIVTEKIDSKIVSAGGIPILFSVRGIRAVVEWIDRKADSGELEQMLAKHVPADMLILGTFLREQTEEPTLGLHVRVLEQSQTKTYPAIPGIMALRFCNKTTNPAELDLNNLLYNSLTGCRYDSLEVEWDYLFPEVLRRRNLSRCLWGTSCSVSISNETGTLLKKSQNLLHFISRWVKNQQVVSGYKDACYDRGGGTHAYDRIHCLVSRVATPRLRLINITGGDSGSKAGLFAFRVGNASDLSRFVRVQTVHMQGGAKLFAPHFEKQFGRTNHNGRDEKDRDWPASINGGLKTFFAAITTLISLAPPMRHFSFDGTEDSTTPDEDSTTPDEDSTIPADISDRPYI